MKSWLLLILNLQVCAGLLCAAQEAVSIEISEPANAITAEGDFAYIGVGQRLIVVDISSPLMPRAVGKVGLPDVVQDIEVQGSFAYVAAGDAGLRVVDVQNPRAPRVVGAYDTGGIANNVHLDENLAWVADGPAGLQVLNVTNPTAPAALGAVTTIGAWDVFVSGNFAYVAAEEEGLRVFDISRPEAPDEVGSVRVKTDANGVFVVDQIAYVAGGSGGLRIFDVSSPADPRELGANNRLYARRVYVEDGLAFVAGEGKGLWIADVSNPARPTIVDNSLAVGSANHVFVAGDYNFVANEAGDMVVMQRAPRSGRELPRASLRLTSRHLPD